MRKLRILKMSKTIGFSLNAQQIGELCQELNVDPDKLGIEIKKILVTKQPLFAERKPDRPEDVVKKMGLQDLRKLVGQKGSSTKAIKAKGLYYVQNVENYISDFLKFWNGDPQRIGEIIFELQQQTLKEYAARELAFRLSTQ